MIDYIKTQWLNVDIFFHTYLDELLLNTDEVPEEKIIQIWIVICQFVLDGLIRREKVRTKTLSFLFLAK